MHAVKELENGFEYLEIKNSVASAKIALQGAHIFSFKRSGKEDMLWLSSTSEFQIGSAIRGGIPLCWPRFGNLDTALPQHGFARTFLFDVIKVEDSEKRTVVHMQLKSSEESKKIWDYDFELDIIFTVSETLEVEMKTTNKDTKEFLITEAFHTYFAVSNIEDVKIFELEDKSYLDSLTGKDEVQKGIITIDKEVDRIYKESSNEIRLEDTNQKIIIKSKNSASVIVWNPWIEKCSKMSGMDKEGYKKFVCIESANALDDFKVITPNAVYSFSIELFGSEK